MLFVNPVLCWPKTLRVTSHLITFRHVCLDSSRNDERHFYVLEVLREEMIINYSTFCVVLWFARILLNSNPKKIIWEKRISSFSWETKHVLIDVHFQCIKCHKKCKTLMNSTELNCRSLPLSLNCTESVHLMFRCLYFLSGIWLEIPAPSLPPSILSYSIWFADLML